MRKAAIASLAIISVATSSFAVTGTEIEELFQEIMSKERGDLSQKIGGMPDPFVNANISSQTQIPTTTNSDTNKSAQMYELMGTIGNLAKINDKWYKTGDAIDSYKVASIKKGEVFLVPSGTIENTQSMKLKMESNKNLNVKAVKQNEKKQSK